MADHIAQRGVHHFRLTVSDVERAVTFYTEVLGFKKLMDLNPGAFLSNGEGGPGHRPHPDPAGPSRATASTRTGSAWIT